MSQIFMVQNVYSVGLCMHSA